MTKSRRNSILSFAPEIARAHILGRIISFTNTARNHNRFVLQPLTQVTKRNRTSKMWAKKNDCLTVNLSLSLVLRARFFDWADINVIHFTVFYNINCNRICAISRTQNVPHCGQFLYVCVCRDRYILHIRPFFVLSGISEIVVSHKWDINSTPKLRLAHNGAQCLGRAQIHQTSAARLHIYGYESGNGWVVARSSVFFHCVMMMMMAAASMAERCSHKKCDQWPCVCVDAKMPWWAFSWFSAFIPVFLLIIIRSGSMRPNAQYESCDSTMSREWVHQPNKWKGWLAGW